MEKNHVAMLFERTIVNPNVYFFKPICLLEGKYLKEGVFIDQYDNTYYDLLGCHIGMYETDEYFGFPTSVAEFNNTKDRKEFIQLFIEDINSNLYFGVTNDNTGELDLLKFPLNNIYNKSFTEPTKVETQTSEVSDDIKTRFYFPEETIKELLNKGDIEEIKNFFRQILGVAGIIQKEVLEKKTEGVKLLPEKSKVLDTKKDKCDDLPFNINELYKYVTSKVINQDEAVRKIILNFALNYLAITKGNIENFKPTRCLITGPTGSGKSFIIETMLEYLEKEHSINIPVVKAPTSQLTVAGYVGTDLEDLLEELVSKSPSELSIEERIKYAEKHGVIFFDEIDKKGSPSNGDVSGRGVLNSLLQFLDGTRYTIEIKKNKFYFNTKYLNIFASGAFTHVLEETKKGSIGFSSNEVSQNKNVTIEDYIKKGNMPSEFMGRFPQIVNLNSLGVEELKNILKNSTASPLIVERAKLALAGINLAWDETYIEEVAKKAYNLKIGARSLQTIIEESLFDMSWEALTARKDKTITLTKDIVEKDKQYQKI